MFQANGEDLALFSILLQHATQITLQKCSGKRQSEKLVVTVGRRHTFTCGGATVVFEVRAVLALIVFGAVAVVVCGQVEAGGSVLTRIWGAVIDIQLG